MTRTLLLAALATLLSSAGVHARPTLGEQVVARIAELPSPSATMSPFAKWVHNTSGFTGLACWRAFGTGSPPPAALTGPILSAGSFTAIVDSRLQSVCEDIAEKGIVPVCTHTIVTSSPRNPDRTLAREYLQFDSAAAAPEVSGVLGCYLTPSQLNRQVYAGSLEARWTQLPRLQAFETGTGSRTLNAGTLKITAKGVPGLGSSGVYVEYRTGIVP